MKKILLFAITVMASFSNLFALNSGDLMIVGYNTDSSGAPNNTAEIAIIATVAIPEGTVFKITDAGWLNTSAFRTGEGAYETTVPTGGWAAGDVIVYVYDKTGTNPLIDVFLNGVSIGLTSTVKLTATPFTGNLNLSSSGDQIIIFQGTAASPTFIAGLHMAAAWDANATSANTSAAPTSLASTDGEILLNLSSTLDDNAVYSSTTYQRGGATCPGVNCTRANLIADIKADLPPKRKVAALANWSSSGTVRQTMPGAGYLPISLVSATAAATPNGVSLNWATASESNNSHFEIEQLVNGTWTKVAEVAGKGTTSEMSTYTYEVQSDAKGMFTFRIKQVDVDGSSTYSKEMSVLSELPSQVVLGDAYPNPFSQNAQFNVSVAQEQVVKVSLYNVLGQEVAVLFEGALKANEIQQVGIVAKNLPAGQYFYQVAGTAFSTVKSVIVIR